MRARERFGAGDAAAFLRRRLHDDAIEVEPLPGGGGIAGPQRLGIHGIWNDYRRRGLPEGSPVVPDRIIHSLGELVSEE